MPPTKFERSNCGLLRGKRSWEEKDIHGVGVNRLVRRGNEEQGVYVCVCVQVILYGAVRPCFVRMLTELIAFEAGIDSRVVVESCVVVDSCIGLVKSKSVQMRDEVVMGLGD